MQWWCQYGDLGAHPRVGGENQGPASGVDQESGSSPRRRGKLAWKTVTGTMSRLIPA